MGSDYVGLRFIAGTRRSPRVQNYRQRIRLNRVLALLIAAAIVVLIIFMLQDTPLFSGG